MYSFFTAFEPYMMLLCFSGAAMGIIWAALPGLSTTMAMALLVGLTYRMPTEPAIIFILGTFTGSVFGGAISAVLINIPGTPDAVPTQMAGFPLAKQGKGGLVLGMSITASMVGNWIGILLLVTCVSYVLDIALKFASWEVALLALWGISISGTLTAGEAPVKGWISGWMGVLIAMVGREEIHGIERFTFGSQELLLGIPYIPVLIGLFGLTEIIMVLSQPQPYVIPQKIGRIFPPIKEFLKYWKSIIRSSIVGLITGIIPGVLSVHPSWDSSPESFREPGPTWPPLYPTASVNVLPASAFPRAAWKAWSARRSPTTPISVVHYCPHWFWVSPAVQP